MVDAALRAAVIGIALYVAAPRRPGERFVIEGRPVSADALAAAVDDVRGAIDTLRREGTPPSADVLRSDHGGSRSSCFGRRTWRSPSLEWEWAAVSMPPTWSSRS